LYELYDLALKASNLPIGEERQNVTNQLINIYKRGIIAYNKTLIHKYKTASNIFYHSLYFPAIMVWIRKLGVVSSYELSVNILRVSY
jgi:hypothetical protein